MENRVSPRLSSINLHLVIPDVFADNDVAGSQIWLCDFSFERGHHYLVEAASGSGKSSMCSFIYNSRRDYRGTLSYDDRDARSLKPDEVSTLRTGYISLLPQELRLFGEMTAGDNVRLKNKLTGYCSESDIAAMFERLGIADKIDCPASQLSIGQMQRVALIRALCQPFDFLLLDEPVSHLDGTNNAIAGELVFEAATRQGSSVIATSVGNNLILPTDDIKHVKL